MHACADIVQWTGVILRITITGNRFRRHVNADTRPSYSSSGHGSVFLGFVTLTRELVDVIPWKLVSRRTVFGVSLSKSGTAEQEIACSLAKTLHSALPSDCGFEHRLGFCAAGLGHSQEIPRKPD